MRRACQLDACRRTCPNATSRRILRQHCKCRSVLISLLVVDSALGIARVLAGGLARLTRSDTSNEEAHYAGAPDVARSNHKPVCSARSGLRDLDFCEIRTGVQSLSNRMNLWLPIDGGRPRGK